MDIFKTKTIKLFSICGLVYNFFLILSEIKTLLLVRKLRLSYKKNQTLNWET